MRSRAFTVSRKLVPDPRGPHLSSKPERVTPYLRLSGAWLSRLGFAIGSRVRVAAEPGRLVLELAEPAGEVAEAPAAGAAEASAVPRRSPLGSVSGNERPAQRGPGRPAPRAAGRRPARPRRAVTEGLQPPGGA